MQLKPEMVKKREKFLKKICKKILFIFRSEEAKSENIPEKKSKETSQPSVKPINLGPTSTPLWTFEEFQENLLKFVPYPTPPRNDLK